MKNKTRVIHKTLSFILIILMLFIPVLSTVGAETIVAEPINADDKLTESLKAHLETIEDDEYVPVYIWLEDYGEDMFYQVLSKRLGVSITEQNEEAYIGSKVAEKVQLFEENLEIMKANASTYGLQATETGEIDIKSFSPMLFRAKASISDTMTDTEIQNCLNSGMTSTEIINLSERHQYLKDYRQTRKLVNTTANQEFSRLLDLTKCRNVSLDPLLAMIHLESKKDYLFQIAEQGAVKKIEEYVEETFVLDDTEDETSQTTSTGYHMVKNENIQYDGSGIKIGVIEVPTSFYDEYDNVLPEKGVYYDNNVHLSEKTSSQLIKNYSFISNIYRANRTISNHATTVLSIVGGDEVSGVDGVKYTGIAPRSTLYYTIYMSSEDFSNSILWCIESGANIINMSFGTPYGYYSPLDRYVDYVITEYRVVIVKSAGNYHSENNSSSFVSSPGLAYNAITVGNVTCDETSSGQYLLSSNSAYYQQFEYLTNKPDLSAFGTKIHLLDTTYNPENRGSGTSYAAPMVAGAAALVMQANTDLIGKPDTVKAILLGSADETAISVELNDENGGLTSASFHYDSSKIQEPSSTLREKSGAGLLNIEAAIRMANSNLFYACGITDNESLITETYYFGANTDIEFGVVYENPYDEIVSTILSNDVYIQVLDSNNNSVFTSTDGVNNVELYECRIKTAGEYRFKVSYGYIDVGICTNATFFLSCGCSEKMISHSNYEDSHHTVSCSNIGCNFTCQEKHREVEITKTTSYGISVTFSSYYLPIKYNKTNYREFDYWSGFVVTDYSTTRNDIIIFTVVPSYGNTQTTQTGEIISRTYEVIGVTSTGTDIFPEIGVTAYIDYFDQTLSLS